MGMRAYDRIPQGGYIKRFYDATNDDTELDRVNRKYNELKEASRKECYDVQPDVFVVIGGFFLWLSIMLIVVIGVYLIHTYFPGLLK